ncbi:MAG: flavin reductase family protein [Bacteroidetes bacterium]|nr:flavin reductase family protein [Bacteroidota bacterium]
MITINPGDLKIPEVHRLLLGSVGPRPICFASTVDSSGNRNLSPFSFFNVFSSNPPVLVFSPSRSGRTGATKDTYENCKEVPEVVINIVNYEMVEQMSLASSPYAKGVDEFVKSGFTPVDSDLIKPARVKESPVQFECKVNEIISLGEGGGAGNLIICEVLRMHFREDVMLDDHHVDQTKIDLVARMGGDFYCRAHGSALFEIPKPLTTIGVGIDALPANIRNSSLLSGNDLGRIAQMETIPTEAEIFAAESTTPEVAVEKARNLIKSHNREEAFCILAKNLPYE